LPEDQAAQVRKPFSQSHPTKISFAIDAVARISALAALSSAVFAAGATHIPGEVLRFSASSDSFGLSAHVSWALSQDFPDRA